MKLYKKLACFTVVMLVPILYYVVSSWIGIGGKLIISTVVGIALMVTYIIFLAKISKGMKTKLALNIILICIFIFTFKWFVDIGNLSVIVRSSKTYKQTTLALDKINETIKYNNTFNNVKYKNDRIYYHNDLEPAMDLICAYIDKAKTQDTKIFGIMKHSTVSIKFDYDKQNFKNRNPAFKDYSGLYSPKDKKIYVLVEDCYKNALTLKAASYELKYTVIHEYTHHMFFDFLNENNIESNNIPIWFNEGIADYVGYGQDESSLPKTLVEFKSMNNLTQWLNYNNNGYDTYAQSRLAIRELINIKGNSVIRNIIMETKNRSFEDAFKFVTGFTLEEFKVQLDEDMKNDWERYYDSLYNDDNIEDYSDIQIKCLQKYLVQKPENIDARMDLAYLYDSVGSFKEAKEQLLMVIDKKPNNALAIGKLARVYVELEDFDSAINNYEKEIKLVPKKSVAYVNLAQILLLKDVNKSLDIMEEAKAIDKSKYISIEYEQISNYRDAIKENKPFEGCLSLINSDAFYTNQVKFALINKTIKDYPNIKNPARTELEKKYKKYK